MQTISVTKCQVNEKDLLKKSALDSDTEIEYSEPTVFTHEGQPIIFYGDIDGVQDVRKACLTIKYHSGERSSGLKGGTCRTFGAMPRDPLRKDYTSLSSMAYGFPAATTAFYDLGDRFNGLYQALAPEIYAAHREKVMAILPEWRIRDTAFTSGIVNSSNSLKYHYDRGNFKGALSCMLTLRKNIGGGCLSIPEFNMRLRLRDSTYLLFDGQKILHGVTPIKHLGDDSYRYTVVYYALEALTRSKTTDEELAECRRRSTEKYNRRAGFTK